MPSLREVDGAPALVELVGRGRLGELVVGRPSRPQLGLRLFVRGLQPGGVGWQLQVLEQWHEKQMELLARAPELDEYRSSFAAASEGKSRRGAVLHRLQQAAIFARRTPWIFILAWCHFGIFPIVLYSIPYAGPPV